MKGEREQKPREVAGSGTGAHKPSSISVIIPTRNERKNIVSVIKRCCDSLKPYDFEIIVVDDDSPDKTWQVARETYQNNENVSVVRRNATADLATAVSRGFYESTKDVCIVIDADLQHPPEKIPVLFEALRAGADIAIGSRYLGEGGIESWSRFRRLVSKGAILIAWIGVPTTRSLTDPVSGFFAVRKDRLKSVELEPRGYKILLEVLVKCDWDEITEVPYVFTERDQGRSSLSGSEYIRFLEHIIRLGVISRGWDDVVAPTRAVRLFEFGFIGAIGACLNTLVFISAYNVFQIWHLFAGTLAFLVAVNWNFIGNWLLTFDRPDGNLFRQYVTFHCVCLGGFVVYLSILALAIDTLSLPALLANAIAIGAGATVNFLGAENIAFTKVTLSLLGSLSNEELSTSFSSMNKGSRVVRNGKKKLIKIIRVLK